MTHWFRTPVIGGPVRVRGAVKVEETRDSALTQALPGYHRSPRWSSDGTRIAFQSGGTIYLVPALGGTPRALVSPARRHWVAFPAWSPDGMEIAYVEDEAMYVRPVARGEPRRLVSGHSISRP